MPNAKIGFEKAYDICEEINDSLCQFYLEAKLREEVRGEYYTESGIRISIGCREEIEVYWCCNYDQDFDDLIFSVYPYTVNEKEFKQILLERIKEKTEYYRRLIHNLDEETANIK